MKKYQLLEAEFTDYNTFKPFPGADEFKEEFKKFSIGPRKFKFFEEQKKEMEMAEIRLGELKLVYKNHYCLEFESDCELKKYSCVIISFPYEEILVKGSVNTFFVDTKKMTKFHVVEDRSSGSLVMTPKGKSFFEKEMENLTITDISDKTGKKKYYLLSSLHLLSYPRIYKKVKEITSSYSEKTAAKFIVIDQDGRLTFSKNAIKEIEKYRLCKSSTFMYDNNEYDAALNITICTGEFAYEIKKIFGGEENSIFITPISLDEF
jgi:hypothetical protein